MNQKTTFILAVLLWAGAYVVMGTAIAANHSGQNQNQAQQALVSQIQAILDANPGMTVLEASEQLIDVEGVTEPGQVARILTAGFSMLANPTQEDAGAFEQAAANRDTNLNLSQFGFRQSPSLPPVAAVVTAPPPTIGTDGGGGGSN